MKKLQNLVLLLLIILLSVPGARGASPAVTSGEVEKALGELDSELSRRPKYIERRQHGIDSLRTVRGKMAPNSGQWLDVTLEIGSRYGTFNNDSALLYLQNGMEGAEAVGDPTRLAAFRMQAAVAMARGGMLDDAMRLHAMIDSTTLSHDNLVSYYSFGRQMYSYISTHYEGYTDKYAYWRDRSIAAQKALLPLLTPGSVTYRRNLGEYLLTTGQYSKARQTLTDLLKALPPDDPEYAIVSHVLADISAASGDHLGYIYYLAKSAISDVRRANFEVTSLQELGGALFEDGDSRRAHSYLTVAMANAVDSRASARILRTTELLSVVEKDHLDQVRRYKIASTIIIAVLVVLMMALAILIWYLRKQLVHVSALKETLQEASRSKNVYLSQFMTLCLTYMDRLRDFSKLVNRKISAGNADELLALTKSGKFVDEQSQSFYEAFDEAFLHIYPNFVNELNSLLRPEERIDTAQLSGRLNTALRIYAFMRLGVDDASRIARALNLSVNTVYAYRNRLRNRAVDRDGFEASVLAIKGL